MTISTQAKHLASVASATMTARLTLALALQVEEDIIVRELPILALTLIYKTHAHFGMLERLPRIEDQVVADCTAAQDDHETITSVTVALTKKEAAVLWLELTSASIGARRALREYQRSERA